MVPIRTRDAGAAAQMREGGRGPPPRGDDEGRQPKEQCVGHRPSVTLARRGRSWRAASGGALGGQQRLIPCQQ